jgi:hypothetical protein
MHIYQDAFSDFMQRLRLEMLKLEFHQFDVVDDTISLQDFGRSILAFGPQHNLTEPLKKLLDFKASTPERISFGQFLEFDRMIKTKLGDIGKYI